MNNVEYIKNVPQLRRAIRESRDVYVAVMCGNMTYSVRVSKIEARAFADQAAQWQDLEDLDVAALGFVDGATVYLGGL